MAANTRKASTARKTTARAPRTPRELAPEVREDFDEEEASPAEAQRLEAEGHYVTAELCGEELQIIPPGAWRQSWQDLLHGGQIKAFAKIVMPEEDFEVFVDIDPTNDEFGEFVGEAAHRAGESQGKSRGPVTSSRRTRRR